MSVLQRVSNMFKAKVNNALDEMENPIELLDQKIRDMDESLNSAKLSSAEIIGNVHEIKKKMDDTMTESKDYDEKVKFALAKGNEELAKKALEKKLDSDKRYANLKQSYEDSSKKAELLKEKLRSLGDEIEKTRNYRDEAAARYKNAEASEKVNEILAKVDTKDNSINIDDIERKIQNKESVAEGLEELRDDTSLDKEFEKLGEANLDDELARYKESLK